MIICHSLAIRKRRIYVLEQSNRARGHMAHKMSESIIGQTLFCQIQYAYIAVQLAR